MQVGFLDAGAIVKVSNTLQHQVTKTDGASNRSAGFQGLLISVVLNSAQTQGPGFKPLSGGNRDQNIPWCPLYSAGVAGKIALDLMSYRDIVIEGLPASDDYHSPPVLPEEYMREYLSCIPKIPLPNGRFVFYIRAHTSVIERLEIDARVRAAIVARSWSELFFGNYPHWDWVFDADVTEAIEGVPHRLRKKVALVSDQEIHGIYVPGVFLGDQVP